MDIGKISIGILVAVLVLLLLFCLAQMVVVASVEAECWAHGWKDGKVTWNFKGYCVREINETEFVIPLNELVSE